MSIGGDCVVVGPFGRVLEAQEMPYDGHCVHFQQGPADISRGNAGSNRWRLNLTYAAVAPSADTFRVQASGILFDPWVSGHFNKWQQNGMTYAITQEAGEGGYHFRWFFRGGGSSSAVALALDDAAGWQRAGVDVNQTMNRSEAHVEVEVVQSIPDFPTAAGVYRWGQGNKPEVLLVARYMQDPSFAEHLVNHEFGHAIYRIYDMIPARGFPFYSGIMDYVGVEGVPNDREVEDVRRWLTGQGVVQ